VVHSTYLDLHSTDITDAGVAHLAVLPALRSLKLSGTGVTNAGIRLLPNLALTTLGVAYTVVDEEGLV